MADIETSQDIYTPSIDPEEHKVYTEAIFFLVSKL